MRDAQVHYNKPVSGNSQDARVHHAQPSGAFGRYLSRRRIPNLDGLRGLAILLVLAHHVPVAAYDWVARLQHNGKHGVSLFFVISGYIVMTLILRESRSAGSVDVRGFLVRRALRLLPLYYVVLLGEAVLVFLAQAYSPENQALFSDKLACYVFYCSNWLETSGEGPFFVAWSLAVEEQFYLALAGLLLFWRPQSLVPLAAALLLLKPALVLAWPQLDPALLPWRILLSYSEAILLGVLLACLLDHARGFAVFSRLVAVPGAVGLLFVAAGAFLLFGDLGSKTSLAALSFYLVCTLLVGACASGVGLPVLDGRLLPRIGVLSYGIYLMHMPVLSAVKRVTTEPAQVLCLTLLAVIPLAWLSFRFFEEPVRNLGRRPRRELEAPVPTIAPERA